MENSANIDQATWNRERSPEELRSRVLSRLTSASLQDIELDI